MITRKPIAGFKSISLAQVIAADQALWQVISQETRGKILTVGSPKPIDAAVALAKDSPEVVYHLLPLRDNKRTHEDDSDKDKKNKKQKKEKYERKNQEERKPGKVDLPPNCSAKNDANQNICFAFNRKACSVRGAKCRRGLHVCWKVGCFGRHAHGPTATPTRQSDNQGAAQVQWLDKTWATNRYPVCMNLRSGTMTF